MSNLIDLNKRRLEYRDNLRLMGFSDESLDRIEEGMTKMVDQMVAAGWQPIEGMLSAQMLEAFIATRAGMSRGDAETVRRDTFDACWRCGKQLADDLKAIETHAAQTDARRVTDYHDAWTTAANASEYDLTKG